jgi:hypothetical protein
MVAVAVGVGVAAAAAAAQAGMAMSKGGGPGGSGITVPQFTPQENRSNQQINQLLSESRRTGEAGVGTQALLQPELLKALGYDVQYTDNRAGIDAAAQALSQSQSDLEATQTRLEDVKAGLNGGKKSGMRIQGKDARKAARQELAQLKAKQQLLKKQIPQQQSELGRIQTNPYTITGINQKTGPGTPSAVEQQQQQIQEALGRKGIAALAGGLPDDPQLVRELGQQEDILRNRLVQVLGPDYEFTTQGQAALRDFNQRKEETLQTERERVIRSFVPLQADLASASLNRTTSRQGAAENIAAAQLAGAAALGGISRDFVAGQEPYQALRGQQQSAQQRKAELNAQADALAYQRMQEGIGKIGQMGSAVSYLGAGGGGGASTASTAPSSNIMSSGAPGEYGFSYGG